MNKNKSIFFTFILALSVSLAVYLGLKVFSSILLTFIMYYGIICILIPIIDLIVVKRKTFKEMLEILGFKNIKKGILFSFITGIIVFFLIFVFFTLLKDNVLDMGYVEDLLSQWGLNKRYILFFLFTMIFTNGFLEEIWWRGYIYHRLRKDFNISLTIAVSGSLFTLHHYITVSSLFPVLYGKLFIFAILISGMIWAYIRYRFSLLSCIIIHIFADLAIMVIYVIN